MNLEKLCETHTKVVRQIDALSYTHKHNKYYYAQMNFLYAVLDFIYIKLKTINADLNGYPF